MPSLAQVKEAAARMFSGGKPEVALRLYDAIVAAAPLCHDARIRVADCAMAMGKTAEAAAVYRSVAWYCLRAGHPLAALVCARVLQAHGQLADDLLATLVVTYGSESEQIGKLAARIASPPPDTEVPVPDGTGAAPADLMSRALARAEHATDDISRWPAALHPIPLFSALSEAAFRRVLATVTLQRLPADTLVIREGEPGTSFFFVAAGELCVFSGGGPMGGPVELARLHENAVFGEMALLSAQPRSASVRTVGEVDLFELGRQSLAAVADEVASVAQALHGFTRDRLLGNLMAQSPLFRPFDRQQQRELLRRFTSHDVSTGTVIIHEGEPGRGLFVVLTGELEVTRRGPDGLVQALGVLHSGEVFGEISLLRGNLTSATVAASRPSTVLFLGREYVERMAAAFPQLRRYLEQVAGDREIDNQLAAGIDVDLEDDARVMV